MLSGASITALESVSIGHVLGFLVVGVITYSASLVIYNLYFHPLRNFPGPKAHAASMYPLTRNSLTGRSHEIIKSLHDKYGPIVRLSPGSLSFNSARAWKDIYGHATTGRKRWVKSKRYSQGEAANLVTERNEERHGQIKRLFSHAFSAKSLEEQEGIVQDYVDLLVKQIWSRGEETDGTGKRKEGWEMEMTSWYNWFTFDVIGDLAFGEPFGCLKKGEPHFWVALISESLRSTTYRMALRSIPLIGPLLPYVITKSAQQALNQHKQYSAEKTRRRMANKEPRKDFWTEALKNGATDIMSEQEFISNSRVMIVAGSETTATFLAGVTYYLCRNPSVYKKLTTEIRTAFASYSEINGRSTSHLPYLKACIDEGLRIYPPVPIGLGRISPGETVDDVFIPEGAVCFVSSWAATHSERNFHDPYEFEPERWLDEGGDKKDASQPFLLGARVCIGRNLALLEMRLVLAKMLWALDMELIKGVGTSVKDGLEWNRDSNVYTLWGKPGLDVRFRKREGVEVPKEVLDGRL